MYNHIKIKPVKKKKLKSSGFFLNIVKFQFVIFVNMPKYEGHSE